MCLLLDAATRKSSLLFSGGAIAYQLSSEGKSETLLLESSRLYP